MNAVGNIGQFIIDNQYAIEAALLVLLALIIVFFLVSKLVFSKKRKAEIEELNAKLEKIESEVKGISDQTADSKNVKIVLKTDDNETVIETVKLEGDVGHEAEIEIETEGESLGSETEGESIAQEAENEVSASEVDEGCEEPEAVVETVKETIDEEERTAVSEGEIDAINAEEPPSADDASEDEIDKEELQRALDSLDEIMAEIKNSDLDLLHEDLVQPKVKPVELTGSKFTSRDWNRDRHGNQYTEEMLNELIG